MTLNHRRCLFITAAFVVFVIFQEPSPPVLDLHSYVAKNPHRQAQTLLDIRSLRFPSAEERVKIYMSNWYVPPCQGGNFIEISDINVTSLAVRESITTRQSDNKESGRTLVFKNDVLINRIFFLDRHKLWDCAYHGVSPAAYCRDVQYTLLPALDRVNNGSVIPIFFQFGDLAYSHGLGPVNIPHIRKIRYATTKVNLSAVTSSKECYSGPRDPLITNLQNKPLQPIIWNLNTPRHYAMLAYVQNNDTLWSLKINKAVFRGALTGLMRAKNEKGKSAFDNCMLSQRCRLVFQHDKSTLVDARLTPPVSPVALGFINKTVNGVSLFDKMFTMQQMLQYKAIIILEGNDVASGLKWALLSNSVVLMQSPMFTSWAMEEMLEPWVHYIPLNRDLSDVEENMQWVLDNDEQAQRIAERGSLWIQDLVFHPDASIDDQWIQEEILRRYLAHFAMNAHESSNRVEATAKILTSIPNRDLYRPL
jgi:hypothetical protein